jgi:hypothetical protein
MNLTQQEAIETQFGLFTEALSILMAKRKDYSGAEDPYGNFRACEAYGVPAALGALIRLTDKVNRLGHLISSGTALQGGLVGEAVTDTLRDVINYAAIIAGLLSEHDEGMKQALIDAAARLESTLHEIRKQVGPDLQSDF